MPSIDELIEVINSLGLDAKLDYDLREKILKRLKYLQLKIKHSTLNYSLNSECENIDDLRKHYQKLREIVSGVIDSEKNDSSNIFAKKYENLGKLFSKEQLQIFANELLEESMYKYTLDNTNAAGVMNAITSDLLDVMKR